MRELCEECKFHYENTSKGSFFVIEVSKEEKIQTIQSEQINNNSFPGILKFNINDKGDKLELYYNITSRIVLEQFLKKRKLKKNEFVGIIQAVARTLINSLNYLIYDRNLLMDKRHIYINSSTLEVRLMYLPVASNADILEDYKEFVLDLITKSAAIDESEDDTYLSRIINSLKDDSFNLEDFNRVLNEILLTGGIGKEEPKPIRDLVENRPSLSANRPVEQPIGNKITLRYKSSSYILALVINLFLFTLALPCITLNAFEKLGDPFSTAAGLCIAVFGVEFLLIRKLFDKSNLKKNQLDVKDSDNSLKNSAYCSKSPEIGGFIRKLVNHPEEIPMDNFNFSMNKGNEENQSAIEKVNKLINNKHNVQKLEVKNEVINETVFLGNPEKKGAYLKGLKNAEDEVNISKDCFVIGRLKPIVDLVLDNKYVGKIHSEIAVHNDNYYIKDINSQNGTFINGLRIDSNKEYILNNGDIITFADCEYMFYDGKANIKCMEALCLQQ